MDGVLKLVSLDPTREEYNYCPLNSNANADSDQLVKYDVLLLNILPQCCSHFFTVLIVNHLKTVSV